MSFAAVLDRLQKADTPYPGLRPFETQESHLFFGRDQQVAELVGRLERTRLVAVLGVSGSGKSSLVRAGLIPALERGGVIEAGRRWRIVVTRPAGAPFETLAAHLRGAGLDPADLRRSSHGLIDVARQLPNDESLLVVVDQFEELFRYKDLEPVGADARRRHVESAAEAADFVQLLLAASRHHPPIFIVLTMRSDYLGDCAEFRDLPEALNECQYLVPRLTREQRKEAIERPLGRVEIAPSAVQRMLNDAGDEPDQLPVLQHALMRTWTRWRASAPGATRRLELQDYEAIGGFDGALNQHADELLAAVPADIAATIFKRLTARGRGNRERRDPAPLRELWAVCGAETVDQQAAVTAVVDHFRRGEATFLAPREGAIGPDTYIDITHESLIRQWKKLRDDWLPQERRSAKTFLDLVQRSMRWKANEGELLGGLDLFDAIAWERQRNPTTAWAAHYAEPADLERVLEFIRASQVNERKRRLRSRTLQVVVPLALLFAALAIVAFNQSLAARRLASVALDRQLTAHYLLAQTGASDNETAVLLAMESLLRFPSSGALDALRSTSATLPRTIAVFHHPAAVKAVAFTADGRHVLTVSADRARRFDSSAKDVPSVNIGPAHLSTHGLSGDGRLLVTSVGGTVAFVDLATGREQRALPINAGSVSALSDNGRYFATVSSDAAVSVFDTATGLSLGRVVHTSPVVSVAISDSGEWLATGTSIPAPSPPTNPPQLPKPLPPDANAARVTVIATGATLLQMNYPASVRALAFSRSGQHLAVGSEDGTARVVDIGNRVELGRLAHAGGVTAVAFDSGAMRVATGSDDGTARVFESASGLELARLPHDARVDTVAFSGDGRWVVSGSADKTARVFESTGAIEMYRSRQSPASAAFSGDGRRLVLGAGGMEAVSHAEVLEGPSGRSVFVHEPIAPELRDVSISADGNWVILAGGAFNGKTRVFSVADPRTAARDLDGVAVPALKVRISGDGRRAAVLGLHGVVHVFDGAKEILRAGDPFTHGLAMTPDGQYLAIGGGSIDQGTVQVIALPAAPETPPAPNVVRRLQQPQPVFEVAISADGRWVATSSVHQGNATRIFDQSGKEVWSSIGETIESIAIDSTAGLFATGSVNGIVSVRDFSGRAVTPGFQARGQVMALRLVDNGRHLMTASRRAALGAVNDIVVSQYPLRREDVIADACSRVSRNLTREEWNNYVGAEVEYRATCPGRPQ